MHDKKRPDQTEVHRVDTGKHPVDGRDADADKKQKTLRRGKGSVAHRRHHRVKDRGTWSALELDIREVEPAHERWASITEDPQRQVCYR